MKDLDEHDQNQTKDKDHYNPVNRKKKFTWCCYCLQGCRCRDTNFYL